MSRPRRRFVIEFRNGGFFESLEATQSVPFPKAMRFDSEQEAKATMAANQWMYFAGGLVVEVWE